MDPIEATILSKVLDWFWVVLSFGFLFVFRRLKAQDDLLGQLTTAVALIKQHDSTELIRRREDRDLRDSQRREIIQKVDSHHSLVMGKLDALIAKQNQQT